VLLVRQGTGEVRRAERTNEKHSGPPTGKLEEAAERSRRTAHMPRGTTSAPMSPLVVELRREP
jgi:hypothetical protein